MTRFIMMRMELTFIVRRVETTNLRVEIKTMTWWCEHYGAQTLSIGYRLADCENCHLKDKCTQESVTEETKLPFFLTWDEAQMIVEMFDNHDSDIAEKLSNQLLKFAVCDER